MSRQFLIILSFILALGFSSDAMAVSYSSTIEDLPLMAGMKENTAEAIVFDKPGGRIIEMSAAVPASPVSIQKFYQQALPSLGWQATAPLQFTREGEFLKITIEQKGSASLVHFNLQPTREGQ